MVIYSYISLIVFITYNFISQTDELLLYSCLASLDIVFKGWIYSYKLVRVVKDVIKLEVAVHT